MLDQITNWLTSNVWGMLLLGALGSILGVIIIAIARSAGRALLLAGRKMRDSASSAVVNFIMSIIFWHAAQFYPWWRYIIKRKRSGDRASLLTMYSLSWSNFERDVELMLLMILINVGCYVIVSSTHPWFCVFVTVLSFLQIYSTLVSGISAMVVRNFAMDGYFHRLERLVARKRPRVRLLIRAIELQPFMIKERKERLTQKP